MSKHLGNILEPIPLMDQHGADAVRWFMAAVGSPWSARRVGHNTLQEVVRKTLLTYWNTVSFQALYGRTAGWSPSDADPAPADRPVLDRWVLSELNALVQRRGQGNGRVRHARGRASCSRAFVDDLSNWYVRRSRRRFWRGDPAALATLHEALSTVTLLMAPITPFITERVWQDLVVPVTPGAAPSVHLAAVPGGGRVARSTRRCPSRWRSSAGWSNWAGRARADSGMKVRQPLSRALASGAGLREARRGPARGDRGRAERRLGDGHRRRPADPLWTPPPRRTSARSASGSARPCSRWPRRSPRPTRRRSRRRCGEDGAATVTVDGEPVHLEPGRGGRHRDAARGLGGRVRRRRDASRSTCTSRRSCAGPAWPGT